MQKKNKKTKILLEKIIRRKLKVLSVLNAETENNKDCALTKRAMERRMPYEST